MALKNRILWILAMGLCGATMAGSSINPAPEVQAGVDQFLTVPESVTALCGRVTVDALGAPHGGLLYQWAWLEGPGPVDFEPSAFDLSPAVFLEGGPGAYVLELTATDGVWAASDQVTVYLQAGCDATVLAVPESLAVNSPAPGIELQGTDNPRVSDEEPLLPRVADTQFSVDRGFFDAPTDVTITCDTAGATLVYTTDGSIPTPQHGHAHPAPVTVTISTTTILRAMAYHAGMRATDIDTQTYLFLADVIKQPDDVPGYPRPWAWLGGSHYDYHDYGMDPGIVDHPDYRDEIIPALTAIPTMSIAVDPGELADENGFYWGAGETVCSVEIIYPEDPQKNVRANAGIEPHSHNRLKRSLRLNFRAEYGDAKLKASLIQRGSPYGDSATDTFDRIILRGGNNRSWARSWNPDKTTYAIDQFYRDTQVALSGYGSRGAFVHLYINGLYWGLYNPVERTDQWFASVYFGGEPEAWFAIHHGSQSKLGFNGDSARYETLMNDLIRRDQSAPDTYALTSQFVDTAGFCDYMLATWWMGVGDWPKNNWYAACRTEDSPLGPTPLRFFAWDGEWSWDASRAGGPGYVHPDFRSHKNSGSSPIPQIWHALRRNDDFMMLFADRVYRHFYHDGPLTEKVAQARWLDLNERIQSAVVAESARWGDAMKHQGHPTRTRNEDWEQEVQAIYNMIEGNSSQFLTHLRQQGYYPDIDPPQFSQRGGAVNRDQTLHLTSPNGSGTVYYTTDDSDPRFSGRVAQETIELPYSCTVKTRVQKGLDWSALNQATFTVGPVWESLRISEIMYHPHDSSSLQDPNTEFIELTNTGQASINLNLVQFVQGVSFTFPPFELATGATVLVVQDSEAFAAQYGSTLPVVGQYRGRLSNGGERITLADPLGRSIVDFRFHDEWYASADGRGYSLEVKDPVGEVPLDDKAAWQPCSEIGGTPGR